MIMLPGMAALWDALPEARIVGGAVRDMLANRPVADVDFAVPLPPETIIARAKAAGLKPVPTGLAHGTVTIVSAGRGFEVTSLRRDVETDGRHARITLTADWREDASRRDFTINAMSATRDGSIFDYFGGRDDLAAGRVRFVGQAATRIAEDYLRILRFFRFFARYGRGAADTEALSAITAQCAKINILSAERVWHELKLIMAAPDPRAALSLMAQTGLLPLLLPQADLPRLTHLLENAAPADPLLRLAALLSGDAPSFAARWRLSQAEARRLHALKQPNRLRPTDDDAALRRALAAEPADILQDRTWACPGDPAAWAGLRQRLSALPRPVFPLRGRDITALGIPPGPRVGQILHSVRQWWLSDGCVADQAACLTQARNVVQATPP